VPVQNSLVQVLKASKSELDPLFNHEFTIKTIMSYLSVNMYRSYTLVYLYEVTILCTEGASHFRTEDTPFVHPEPLSLASSNHKKPYPIEVQASKLSCVGTGAWREWGRVCRR
jgi:hypothetical protein